jgi:hypothetical protein
MPRLFVTTTGASVNITELGYTITHPTTDFEVDAQFTSDEIERAASLTTAIQAGTLIWRKVAAGTNQPAADYDPNFVEIDEENLGPGQTLDRTVTFKDLGTGSAEQKAGFKLNSAFTGNPKKATVTFATNMSNANYSVSIQGLVDARSWLVESITVSGFVINSNANQALVGSVQWEVQGKGD